MSIRSYKISNVSRVLTLGSMGVALSIAQLAPAQNANGPVRMARISSVSGGVEWRPDSSSPWAEAAINTPIRQDAQVWTPSGSRVEVQFDDGSVLRTDSGAVVTLKNLYSDDKGEFTELSLQTGRAYLHATNQYSVYQIDSPDASVEAAGPARMRLTTDQAFKVAVLNGTATVQNQTGQTQISSGRYAEVFAPSSTVAVRDLPPADSWDHQNAVRDAAIYRDDPNLPSSMRVDAGDMEDYGSWSHDSQYGTVWYPHVSQAGWRPYYHGHYVWVSPFGWTWVSTEPWGWAPYHYGTWVDRPHGWCWVPGPAVQYWSPAVVSYSYDGDYVSWAPLAPSEVQYPASLGIGFSSGNWSFFFSIGGVADYYPAGPGWCSPRPWDNGYANRYVNVYNATYVTNQYRNISIVNNRFVPYNSRFGGATRTTLTGFRNGGSFQPLGRNSSATFQHGTWAAARGGAAMFAGPPRLMPARSSFSANRQLASHGPANAMLSRSVYRPSQSSPAMARNVVAAHRTAAPANRTAAGSFNRAPATAQAWRPGQRVNPAVAAANARRSVGYRPGANPAEVRRALQSSSNRQSAAERMTAARPNSARPNVANRGSFNANRSAANNRAVQNNRAAHTNRQAAVNRGHQARQAAVNRARQSNRQPAVNRGHQVRQAAVNRARQGNRQPAVNRGHSQRQAQRNQQVRQSQQRQPRQQPQRQQMQRQPPQRQPQQPRQPRQGGGGGNHGGGGGRDRNRGHGG